MPSTLMWEYCDLCKRRLPTITCKVKKKNILRLCPYCALLLSDRPEFICEGKHNNRISTKRKTGEPNEDFLKKIGESIK